MPARRNPPVSDTWWAKPPFYTATEYQVAKDMWTLLEPRISNLEKRGIFNERIRTLQQEGLAALRDAQLAYENNLYDQFSEASVRSWALATRVYDDVEKTQKRRALRGLILHCPFYSLRFLYGTSFVLLCQYL